MKQIRIISPSGVIDPTFIDGARARLQQWGYEVSEGPHARDAWGRFAGTDEARLADLSEAIRDPQVDMILCSRGGYGMQRIIERVPAIHKPILGFSDITALHQLAGLNGQASLHGIMCKHIATLPEDSLALRGVKKALRGEPLSYKLPTHPLNRVGESMAPIVGGNLSVLYGLQGTPFGLSRFSYQFPILLIEDIGERHYHVDRMMHSLRLSGVLAHLSGLIVGRFSNCEDDPLMPSDVMHTIYEAVADYNYPVLFDFPIGHVEDNRPLWLHTTAHLRITPDGAQLEITSPIR
ncbi:MAG: LD-carboxypeptidase [Paludibacteraceae bacterium]|nr:LD-carboxypeptidase [Paludibacteraceae bacterium]